MYNGGMPTNETGQLKKKTESCGYIGNLSGILRDEIYISSMANGNMDAEDVVAWERISFFFFPNFLTYEWNFIKEI